MEDAWRRFRALARWKQVTAWVVLVWALVLTLSALGGAGKSKHHPTPVASKVRTSADPTTAPTTSGVPSSASTVTSAKRRKTRVDDAAVSARLACHDFTDRVEPVLDSSVAHDDLAPLDRVSQGEPPAGGAVQANSPYADMESGASLASDANSAYKPLLDAMSALGNAIGILSLRDVARAGGKIQRLCADGGATPAGHASAAASRSSTDGHARSSSSASEEGSAVPFPNGPWSGGDQGAFLGACEVGQSTPYCNCALKKVMAVYPDTRRLPGSLLVSGTTASNNPKLFPECAGK